MKKMLQLLLLAVASATAAKAIPTMSIIDYELDGHFLSFMAQIGDPERGLEVLDRNALIYFNGTLMGTAPGMGFERLDLSVFVPPYLVFGGWNEFWGIPVDSTTPTNIAYLYLPSLDEIFGVSVPDASATAGMLAAGLIGLIALRSRTHSRVN